MNKVIDRGKRSKMLSETKAAENISKNPKNFLEISPGTLEIFTPLEIAVGTHFHA